MAASKQKPSREEVLSRYRHETGVTIKNARKQKNMSQEELSSLAGVSAAQIRRIEKGESRATKTTLTKLSPFLDIPYPELLSISGYNNAKGDETLYTKDGEKLNTYKLVSAIYKADSSLIDYLSDFEEIADRDNIQVLKLIILAMRKEVELRESGESDFFMSMFGAMKQFVISSLSELEPENSPK